MCRLVSAILNVFFGQEVYARVLGVEYLTVGVEDSLEATNELFQVACFQSFEFQRPFLVSAVSDCLATSTFKSSKIFWRGLPAQGAKCW